MSIRRLLPARTEIALPEEAEVWDLSSEQADKAFTTLSSETARRALKALYTEPKTASELAKAIDTSLQNVDYHIQNLLEADLIEVASIEYSQTGNEMKVYAPATNAVLVLSTESTAVKIRSMLRNLLSAALVIGIAALLYRHVIVDRLVGVAEVDVWFAPAEDMDEAVDDVDDDHDADAPEDADRTFDAEPIVEPINPLEHLPWLADPGVAFLLGAVVALTVVLLLRWAWLSE